MEVKRQVRYEVKRQVRYSVLLGRDHHDRRPPPPTTTTTKPRGWNSQKQASSSQNKLQNKLRPHKISFKIRFVLSKIRFGIRFVLSKIRFGIRLSKVEAK